MREYKLAPVDGVYQQPVGAYVAFAKAGVVVRERMVAITFLEWFFGAKLGQDDAQLRHVVTALFRKLRILFETRR